jgi:hypothetical protein
LLETIEELVDASLFFIRNFHGNGNGNGNKATQHKISMQKVSTILMLILSGGI